MNQRFNDVGESALTPPDRGQHDRHRYNRPTMGEIAAIYASSENEPGSGREIIVETRGTKELQCHYQREKPPLLTFISH